ncbi:MAG: SusC/RagA family TonB-linked outer membrane protein, partial [Bacteroidaceae bacterium]|nr:SusC/RagA family TonB-linked outer membrane protein [Bacteroidaceae bacterium]
KGAMDNMYYNNNFHKNLLRRWQQPGDITDIPRAEINSKTASYIDTYLTDASYFAIKNITLGYTLPTKVVRGAGLEGVRVFGSVDNLALWTHMKGMDPQYSFSGTTDYSYAPNKTWTLGIEVKF